ncbi:AGAP011197-PA-like protein [Anopheles sinensis]|uniref:AGAP011197-PA-like protein n=1 Tax=Anopheles sinensis TaxID=74873 RepID=A0A084WK36_ANOSI|nr:AGAP011197-PA-like protein [Anopheles sinensis]
MFSRVVSVILCFETVILCKFGDATSEISNASGSLTGYGFEIMMAKLDYLQYKVLELDLGAKEHTEVIMQNQNHLETVFRSLLWSISQLDQAVSYNLSTIQDQSRKILSQQIACANHEQMRAEIVRLAPRPTLSTNSPNLLDLCSTRLKGPFRTCKEVPSKVPGRYLIQPGETDEPFVAFCEQIRFGGGWLLVQRRFDGTLNFNRHWKEYREEFGSTEGEYWIGLERLHRLTTAQSVELLVEMEDFAGNYGYAWYKEFAIGNETEQYVLKKLSGYRGTAGDSLAAHKGMKFSTVDRDNDLADGNCALRNGGGWWYFKCHPSNLNGYYLNKMDWIAIIWHTFKNSTQGLAYTRMMIRAV